MIVTDEAHGPEALRLTCLERLRAGVWVAVTVALAWFEVTAVVPNMPAP